MSLCDSRLPWDVVDVGLAALCAPMVIRNTRDVEARVAYIIRQPKLWLRLRTVAANALQQLQRCVHAQRLDAWARSVKGRARGCSHLSLMLELDATVTELPDDCFVSWEALVCIELHCPSVDRIGANFLHNCTKLTSVHLPSCLTEVGDSFLNVCSSLDRIDLRHTSLRRIKGEGFLSGCVNLTSVQLPACLTEISDYFMGRCTSMEQLDLQHTSLQRIGSDFLLDCGDRLTTVHLPATVEVVFSGFLEGCGRVNVVSTSPAVRAAAAALRP